MGGLAGKAVVVTGASRGMGLGIASVFAAEGARVAMLARGETDLRSAVSKVPGALSIICDVADPDSVKVAFEQIVAAFGGVDVLINNAAIANPQPVEKVDARLAQLEVAVNLLGPLYCMRQAIPLMRARGGGDIINVTSESVRHPYPHLTLYAATKSAVETLSLGLRSELKGSGIRVTVYRSGRVKGTFSREWAPEAARRARAAAEEAGYYAFSGEAIAPEVAGHAMLGLVLLERSAHVDLMELRAS